MNANHNGLGYDKSWYLSLGLFISMYQNESNRVSWNSTRTPLLLFERLYDFKKYPFFCLSPS